MTSPLRRFKTTAAAASAFWVWFFPEMCRGLTQGRDRLTGGRNRKLRRAHGSLQVAVVFSLKAFLADDSADARGRPQRRSVGGGLCTVDVGLADLADVSDQLR